MAEDWKPTQGSEPERFEEPARHEREAARRLAGIANPFARIGADDRSIVQLGIGSSGVPETFVIDGKGTIRYQHIGEIRPEHVALLREKLKEAAE